MFKFRVAVVSMVIAGVGCNEAPIGSEELGQHQQALCVAGDANHVAMAALAVATATELGRWQPARDFTVSQHALDLTSIGKSRCDDGICWNTQAILDLQNARVGEVELANAPFSGKNFQKELVKQYKEQIRCESRPGKKREECSAEPHELSYMSREVGACETVFTFGATTPEGEALENPAQLANKLVYVGYPENPYLAFTSTGDTVSIDPTYGLNEDGSTTAGSCSAACVKVSQVDITGDCCTCNGATRTYSKSTFSSALFLCN